MVLCLMQINTTNGIANSIGALGIAIGNRFGLAYAEDTGTLYGAFENDLYTIDVSTGSASLVGSALVNNWEGLAWSASPSAVPEPSSTALLGLGGLALILRRRR